jgi:hypothetical protein
MADDWLVVSPSGSISSVKSLNLYGSDLSINECEILKEGSLTKKAEYKKTWRSRYFILFKERGDSYDMTYFNVIRYDQKQRMDYCWDLKRSPILQI